MFNSIEFGRFLNSQFNPESENINGTSTTTEPFKTNSVASLFKSSDFLSELYQGEEWNLDSLAVQDSQESSEPPSIFKSQDHIPKLPSLDWDPSNAVPSLNDEAIAQAVAMQSSFEESIAPSPPKPVPFADALKSQDWTVGSISRDVSIHPTMMDHAPTEAPKPAFKAAKSNIFHSRDWLATEFLGTHEEISISPDIFQLDEPTTATTTNATTPTIAPAATNWESMYLGQLQAAAATTSLSPPPVATKKRKRKKRPKVVPTHKQYVEITQHDVLLGRGGKSNHHPGNKRYRDEIMASRPLYAALTTDEEKTAMSQTVVDVIEQMGGRFLEEDKAKENGKNISLGWYVVPNIVARRKASQALREDSDPEKRKAKRARFLAKKARKEQLMQGV